MGYVRKAAVQGLAQGWKNDPEILPILKDLAQSAQNWEVRQAAVQELAQGWKDQPWMFEFLCDRAVNDPFDPSEEYSYHWSRYRWFDPYLDWWIINPRQTALEVIIEQYPDHPQTLLLLRDRAENDPDEQLREFASQKLEQLKGK